MMRERTVLAAACCSGLLLLTSSLRAQETKLERDVDFVRKLATELRFIDLAQSEVERLQTTYRDSDDFKQVFQLGIEIALIGARSNSNREEQRTMFKDALERSAEFIDRYTGEPVADRARVTMIEACYEYGMFLNDEINLAREESPDRVKELEESAAEVYRKGIEACEQVMNHLDGTLDSNDDARRDYFSTWLYKGILQREMARAVKRDREPLSTIARETFEELILDVGEESLLGLRAWFEMSKINEVLGDFAGAFSDYRDTIDSIKLALDDAENFGLSLGAQEYLFNLMQEAYDRGAVALLTQGKSDETLQFVQQFRADLDAYGEEGADPFDVAHAQYGHPVFLTQAQAMAESGQSEAVAQAMELTQKINKAHPNDMIGVRAKKLLSHILEVQSSLVSGTLLFEIAKGDYQNRDYEKALKGLKRAYGAMGDEDRQKFGLELWTLMGKVYGLQSRFLEAYLATAHGLELHSADDPDREEAAFDIFDRAASGFLRDSKGDENDPVVASLKDRHVELTARHGGQGSEAKLLWKDGNRLLAERKYREAAAKYRAVPMGEPEYEPACARLVVALEGANDYEAARQAAADYKAWTKTPEARLERSEQEKARAQQFATIDFFDAYMDYRTATGDGDDAKADPALYQPTIDKLQTWLDTHSQYGPNYVGRSYDMIARLYARLGMVDKAEATYFTLRKAQPNSSLVPLLATQIFASHYEQVKNLETELQALIDAGSTDAAGMKKVERQLEEARRRALASGLDYMANAGSPQYGVLYNTLTIAADLATISTDTKDWKTTEEVGTKVAELFGNDEDYAEKVGLYVDPLVGEALLRQQRFREAVELLTAAEAADDKNYEVKRYLSLAQGGWYEFDRAGNIVEVAGLDDPVAAYDRYWQEYRRFALNPNRGVEAYDLEWYRFHCEAYMFAMRASAKDSKYKTRADRLYGIARSTDDFATLKGLGPEGQRLYGLFTAIR